MNPNTCRSVAKNRRRGAAPLVLLGSATATRSTSMALRNQPHPATHARQTLRMLVERPASTSFQPRAARSNLITWPNQSWN